jgi:hypothetical protein
MLISISQNKIVTIFDKSIEVMSKEEIQNIFVNYSHSIRVFKNNKRTSENCVSSRGHMIDFDEGTTIEEFEKSEAAKRWHYILYTSKSHQIEKNGKTNDRFHVVFPFQSDEKNMERHQKATKKIINVMKSFVLNVDIACSDTARFFFASGDNPNFRFIWGHDNNTKTYITDVEIIEISDKLEQQNNAIKQITLIDDSAPIKIEDDKITAAVEYLYDKKLTYPQFLSAGFSIFANLKESGEELFLKFSENPHFSDSREHLSAKYKSFQKQEYKEYNKKVLFKIANEIAKENGDKIRFFINRNEAIFETDIVYSNENYLEFFNSFCAYDAKTGKYWLNFREGGWTLTSEKAVYSITAHLNYNEIDGQDKSGKDKIKVIPAFKKWLSSAQKRYIKELVFVNRKEAFNEINLFKGFKFESIQGDCTPFTDFVMKILCQNDKYKYDFIMNFFAGTFQFNKIPHYLILKGGEGTGKSFFAKIIQTLLTTEHCLKAVSIEDVTRKFNVHQANKLFCYLEEAFFGGNQETNDKLKSIITNDVINIEIKGGAVFQMPTFCNYMVTTNHDIPTRISKDDRRAVIFGVSEEYKNNNNYFANFQKWLENGGYNNLMYMFLNYKFEQKHWDFNYTVEKKEAKEFSMDSSEKFWLDLLQNNLTYSHYENYEEDTKQYHLNGLTEAGKIYDIYTKYCKTSNLKPESQTIFGTKTKKMLKVEGVRRGERKLTMYELDLSQCILNFNLFFHQEMIAPFEEKKDIETGNKVVQLSSVKAKKTIYEEIKDITNPPF